MRCCLLTLSLICTGPVALAYDPSSFVGTWTTTYGQMVLAEKGEGVGGTYGSNAINGTEKDGKFKFTYTEPGVTGEGEFVLAPDGLSFSGKWRPNGSPGWSNWTGKRVKLPGDEPSDPKPPVFRFGNLPQGLPAYFIEGDADRDGQIGLYEWVKYWDHSEAKLTEFKGLDLNGDGLLTAEEYKRWQKANAPAPAGPGGPPSPGARPGWGQPPVAGNPTQPPTTPGRPGWGQPPSPGQGLEAAKKDSKWQQPKQVPDPKGPVEKK